MKSHTEMQGDGFRDCVINRWKDVIEHGYPGLWFSGVAMFAKFELADEMLFLSSLARFRLY